MIFPLDLKETVVLMVSDNLKHMDRVDIFADEDEYNLLKYHMGLGSMLREHYNLWAEEAVWEYLDSNIAEDFMFCHPDDLSFEFMKEAQRLINE